MPQAGATRISRWRVCAAILFAVLLPVACRLALSFLDPALSGSDGAASLAWINAVLVVPFALVLWTLTGRALLTVWLGWWALWGLYALNDVKLEQLNRTLSPGDLAVVGQVLDNLSLFWRYADVDWKGALAALAVVVVAAALAVREPRTLPRVAWRLPLLVASLLLASSLLAGHSPWRTQISDARLGGFLFWSPDQSTRRCGLVAGLVRMTWQRVGTSHDPSADELDALRQFTDSHARELRVLASIQGPSVTPDIVVVQSEALFDPGRLRGIDEGAWLPRLRALQGRGMHGELRVPAFGGATIQTEFEVLTGLPLAAFPGVSYPYYGLTDHPLPALPQRLRQIGYATFAVHPYERTFWNRDRAFARLGFDTAHFEGSGVLRDAVRRGPYIADETAYGATLSLLGGDRPQFAFVITMENHSPWKRRGNIDPAERDGIVVPAGLSPETAEALRTYLLHLRHGDVALGEFAEALLARDRPTLLLLYGDHLPGLIQVYEELGFDDGHAPWVQPVPYVIAANYPIETGRRDTTADALPVLLMQQAGFPVTGYFAQSHLIRSATGRCPGVQHCAALLHLAARIEQSR